MKSNCHALKGRWRDLCISPVSAWLKVKSNFEVVDICYYLMCPVCSVVQEASLQWRVWKGKKMTHFFFSLKCSFRTCNIPIKMTSWLEIQVGAKFLSLYCSRFPPGRSCWHGLCSCSHCSTAGVYHWIVGASGNTFETQCLASNTYKTSVNASYRVIPVMSLAQILQNVQAALKFVVKSVGFYLNRTTTELPGPGRSRESQKEIGGSNAPNCCSPFPLVQKTLGIWLKCAEIQFSTSWSWWTQLPCWIVDMRKQTKIGKDIHSYTP